MHMYRDVSRDVLVQYYIPFVRITRIFRDVSRTRTMYCSGTLLDTLRV